MGTRTTKLPRMTAPTAACQVQPEAIKPEASVYVGIQIAIPIQSDAMCHQFQVRRSDDTGARSGLVSLASPAAAVTRVPAWRQTRPRRRTGRTARVPPRANAGLGARAATAYGSQST